MLSPISRISRPLLKNSYACGLCPRECRARRPGERGLCGAGQIRIASYNLHFGEEPPISGINGSGTIFFSGCSLKCVFCQNYPISHLNHGFDISVEKLAEIMLELQADGAHNINFVTPTHFTDSIIEAVLQARKNGFKVPVVWNTSGYEKVEVLKRLCGIVDIYMPDAKFATAQISEKYTEVSDYAEINRRALLEMKSQVGDLETERGIAIKGILVRHLVLPGELENSKKVIKWIFENLGNVYLSLMSQYHPAHKAVGHPVIGRTLSAGEYDEILEFADKLGFTNGFRQEI
ncbi:MAG: radical SAM protein [Elusimicrobia bacterium]|nr:radical SAM protein [Elusimicrobiota bacterium]